LRVTDPIGPCLPCGGGERVAERSADHGPVAAVRAFSPEDIPAIVELFQRVYPEHGWNSAAECRRYFREIFCNSPWRDDDLPSWVAEAQGRIIGFAGVMPRPMLFRGRPIRVVVDCIFMVDPAVRDSLAALQMAQAILAGPQDLTLADGATERACDMWRGLGGEAPLGYNLHWLCPLRPARYLLNAGAAHLRLPRLFKALLLPGAALMDAVATRRPAHEPSGPQSIEEPADAATLAADLPLITDRTLQPRYEEGPLAWVLRQSAQRRGFGTLRARRVLDAARRPLGGYVYYLRRGGVSEVVQLSARDETCDLVLQRLIADARREGAVALRGRCDPDRTRVFSRRHCWMRWEGPATLVHSRRPEILQAIRQGDAFLSRLDGEWWLRFVSG
jgi:hypothetical protein